MTAWGDFDVAPPGTIAGLKARIAELEAALRPFTAEINAPAMADDRWYTRHDLTIGDFRRAIRALKGGLP